MIESIKHKGLKNYWTKGKTKGLNGDWLQRLNIILTALDAADEPENMNYPGSYFHALTGDKLGRFSVRLTHNYRVTFGWNVNKATDVDIEDYH